MWERNEKLQGKIIKSTLNGFLSEQIFSHINIIAHCFSTFQTIKLLATHIQKTLTVITEFNIINFDYIKDQTAEVGEVDSGEGGKKKRWFHLTKFWSRNTVSNSQTRQERCYLNSKKYLVQKLNYIRSREDKSWTWCKWSKSSFAIHSRMPMG